MVHFFYFRSGSKFFGPNLRPAMPLYHSSMKSLLSIIYNIDIVDIETRLFHSSIPLSGSKSLAVDYNK